jgi:hypothetical protein
MEGTMARVRDICRELPECEITGQQHHKITVRRRTLGYHVVDHHGDGRVALEVKVAKGDNEALVASDPVKFFLPTYLAHHSYVGIYLDVGEVDWDEIRELVVDAYRIVAPKRLAALVD